MAGQLSGRRMEGKRVAVVALYSSRCLLFYRLDCANVAGDCGKICLASICGTAAVAGEPASGTIFDHFGLPNVYLICLFFLSGYCVYIAVPTDANWCRHAAAAVACVRGCTKNWSVHVRLMMPCGKASITHSSSKISCSTVIRNNSKRLNLALL